RRTSWECRRSLVPMTWPPLTHESYFEYRLFFVDNRKFILCDILGMSGSAVIQGESLTKVVKLLETHNGRDKLVRLFQYGARFLGYYLKASYPEDSKELAVLEAQSSLARKMFRLFKSLGYLQA